MTTIKDSVGPCDVRYAQNEALWGGNPDSIARLLAERLPAQGARILDIGCGEGRNATFLASEGASVFATDISSIAVERARARGGDTPITWGVADATSMTLTADSFDAVLACSFFHWLADGGEVEKVLERLCRAIRPGGMFALTVFNDERPYSSPAGEKQQPCLLPHSWYRACFDGWTIDHEASDVVVESHAGHTELHEHGVTRLLAVRPHA